MFSFLTIFYLMMLGCVSENSVVPIPDIADKIVISDEPGSEAPMLDVLLVLDNSCSMIRDWDFISYGLTQIPEELNDYGIDWKLGITSMSADDGIFEEVIVGQDPGWSMVVAIRQYRNIAGQDESGFDGALKAQHENPGFFRGGSIPTLIIFVSDESEQSEMTYLEFHNSWLGPRIVASIVGPEFSDDVVCAEAAPKYHHASQVVIDICAEVPWSIIDEIVAP